MGRDAFPNRIDRSPGVIAWFVRGDPISPDCGKDYIRCGLLGCSACASSAASARNFYFAMRDVSQAPTCSGGTSAGILAAFQVRPVGVS